MENLVGKRLDGRYEIQEVVGVGGMAVVYRAYDEIDDRVVAVKVLKDEFLANDEFKRKFKNESKAIAILSHPNIVKVYDVSFGERIQYIVMEYIDGITLKEYISSQGVIPWKEAVHFQVQILKALQHAHDKGVIHRDIKPQNIVLLNNGNIKVTDFGIARFSRSDTRTMTESAIGSVHYISPEQARGDIVDEKADIYSAGVVLYEMITGKVPFEGESAVSVAIQQMQKDAVMPREINPDIPLGLEQITMKSMQKKPADRYRSAAEMIMDLNELILNPNISFEYNYNSADRFNEQATMPIDREALRKELEAEGQKEYDEYDYDDVPPKSKENKKSSAKKKSKKNVGIIVGCLVAILAVAGVLIGLFAGGEKIEVPNFVGLNYSEEIATNSKYADFTFKAVNTDDYDSSKYKPGDVVEQNPEAGKKVRKGRTIILTIAGSMNTEVPNVTGLTLENAQRILREKGFVNVTTKTDTDSEYEANVVSRTEPAAGTSADTNDVITIFVSEGNKYVNMPSVVGMTKSGAQKFLEDDGLKVNFVTKDSEKKKDQVIEQSINEGEKVLKGTTVTLVISAGTTTTAATTEPQNKQVTVTVILSNTGEDGALAAYLNNSKVLSDNVLLNGAAYDITVSGTGKKNLVVNIDGIQYYTCTVDFSKGTYTNESYS